MEEIKEEEPDGQEVLIEAMDRLRHLFIFHEESGVCLYYHPFVDAKIDPQLISGFISAITSFGGKFKHKTAKKKALEEDVVSGEATPDLKELVYMNYHLLMKTCKPCKFAILTSGQASDAVKSKISEFITHFMQTYDEPLKDWKGNVRIFKDVERMVSSDFGFVKVQPEAGEQPREE